MAEETKSVIPIFLFSLPRSGSTLVQRVLSAHPEISTVSEPWLLLPYLYATKNGGVLSEYWHSASSLAIHEFIEHMPNGQDDYESELSRFIQNLYSLVSDENSTYFLDKTPHYHAIAADIIRIFPNAVFILLLRNPLAIAASINNRFNQSRWKLHRRRFDLYDGVENLLELKRLHGANICVVHYEKLVSDQSTDEWKKLFDALNLEFDESYLRSIPNKAVAGVMGDKEGMAKYQDVSSQSINKWAAVFSNPLRKRWARRYLNWIGETRLNELGYSKEQLEAELSKSTTVRYLLSDTIRMSLGSIYSYFNVGAMKYNIRELKEKGSVRQHF